MDRLISILHSELFVQGVGFLGMALSLYSIQHRSYKRVVLFRILNELIFGFQSLLLGAYTGAAANFAACLTNSVYMLRIRKGKSTLPFQICFCILFILIGILTWHGPVSILVMIAKVLSTVSFGINNTRIIRRINLIITPIWLVYDIAVFSLAGILSDLLYFISVISAVIRRDILKNTTPIMHHSRKGTF